MMYILELSKDIHPGQSGGKAFNLARLAVSGYPVPESLVLSREALRFFLGENKLVGVIQSLLRSFPELDWPSRVQRYEQTCMEIQSAPLPRMILEIVNPAVAQLLACSPAGLAIRSSSVSEDLKEASFAGIYESFLGVNDLDGFWRAVVQCWCSAWSPRAAAYAEKMGLELLIDGMAVLVQRLIPASTAGVIFTADPVTGNPWHFVLNAAFGLATELVAGAAPADCYVLEWDTGEILERRIARKPEAVISEGGKLVSTGLSQDRQALPALQDDQIKQVGRLALEIDRLFDQRMDIEWAIAEGQVTLLQARPLNSLPPFFPHTLSAEEAQETWRLQQFLVPIAQDRLLLEMWDRSLTPDDIFPRRKGIERVINGYYYSTEWKWSGNPSGYDLKGVERWLDANEARLRQAWLAQLETAHRANAWLDEAVEKTVRAVDWVGIALEFEREENEMHAAGWYAVQWMIFCCEDLLESFIAEVIPDSGVEGLPGSLLQGLSCYSAVRTAAAQELGRRVEEAIVLEAFADRPVLQVIPFLAAEQPGCRFLKDFKAFCRRYGLEVPHSGEKNQQVLDVESLLLVIKTSLSGAGTKTRDAQDVLAGGARKRLAVENQVRVSIQRRQPDQLERFNKLLDWAQFWTPGLDNRKWHCSMSIRLKDLFRRTGEALVGEGLIERAEDFKLLTRDEWAAYVQKPDAAALVRQVQKSKNVFERNRRLAPFPHLGKPPVPQSSDKARAGPPAGEVPTGGPHPLAQSIKIFQGEGRAPGRARGTAYKITDMEEAGYVEGLTSEHILICGPDRLQSQWRRDWYSLLLVARGLVTVRCPQLSHATQIAREIGIPFINLSSEDFERLPDRVEIEIDGQAGTMTLV